jgi:hypothetical protein
VPEGRIASVEGKADREPLLKNNPEAPANRRLSITLLYRKAGQIIMESPATPIENGVFQ